MIVQWPWMLPLMIGVFAGCARDDVHAPDGLVQVLRKGCASRDAGLVMSHVDLQYRDDLGGPGRLEDDLRQLFAVYGKLTLRAEPVEVSETRIHTNISVEGKRLRFQGPMTMEITHPPSGVLLSSGVLTDLRGIVHALREWRLALEHGAPERFEWVVSPEYGGSLEDRNKLLQSLRDELTRSKALAVMVDDLDIRVKGDRAEVVQSSLLIMLEGERKLENHNRDRFQLRKEGSLWRFVGGLG